MNYYGPVMIDLEGAELIASERQLLQHPAVGGVILFTRNYRDIGTLKQLINDIRSIAQKPLLIAVDHEGGRVWRFKEGFTKLPPAKFFGRKYEEDNTQGLMLAYNAGWIMAAELLDCGIDLSLAPVLDLDKGISEVILDRAFHYDPRVVARIATAFIEGMNTVGMAATGKHFPGHGGCVLDSHFAQPVDDRALETLLADDIIPFQALSELLGAIMPAHIIFPAVDALPVGFSKPWLQEILRQKIGFKGAIISDCLSMKGAAIEGDFIVRTKMALKAGCDMVIIAQQDRESLAEVLNKLDYTQSEESCLRLSALAGKFETEARLHARPTLSLSGENI